MTKKTEIVTLRVTLDQKQLLVKESKRIGVSIGWILRNSYFGEKRHTKYDKLEKQTVIKRLPRPPPIIKTTQTVEPQMRSMKAEFRKEIHEVFEKRNIFIN